MGNTQNILWKTGSFQKTLCCLLTCGNYLQGLGLHYQILLYHDSQLLHSPFEFYVATMGEHTVAKKLHYPELMQHTKEL